MEKRQILLILLAIASSLVMLRACELNRPDHEPHHVPREHDVRVEERPAAPPPPPPGAAPVPVPSHKVVGEDLYDGPDQAKVEQILVVGSETSHDALQALLYEQYEQTIKRASFQYFKAPTDVTIFVYDSRQEAANQTDAWIARLHMQQGEGPDVEIKQ